MHVVQFGHVTNVISIQTEYPSRGESDVNSMEISVVRRSESETKSGGIVSSTFRNANVTVNKL